MVSTKAKQEQASKKKSLTIHIDADHAGPHGMPLVFGSTPEDVGTIKGTVRFSTTYNCKGQGILIVYEAYSEATWTATENKKLVNHHVKEVFGHQTWHFPLPHTKPGGSTVIAGVYEQDFEVSLSPLTPDVPHDMAFPPPLIDSGVALLPSSCSSPNAKVKYIVHALLQRPFPSVNVQVSQELWVLHSSLAPPSPTLPPAPPLQRPLQSPSVVTPPSTETTEHRSLTPAFLDQSTVTPHIPKTHPLRVTTFSSTKTDPAVVTLPKKDHSGIEIMDGLHTGTILSVPGKALQSVFNALIVPAIDTAKARLTRPNTDVPSTHLDTEQSSKETTFAAANSVSNNVSTTADHHLAQTASRLAPNSTFLSDTVRSDVATPLSPGLETLHPGAVDDVPAPPAPVLSHMNLTPAAPQPPMAPLLQAQSPQTTSPASKGNIEYTGLWEPFQIEYCCSLPSEMVHLGQVVPLTIRFGTVKRRSSKGPQRNTGEQRPRTRPQLPRKRFVVKKGLLKLVEHTLLKEVVVSPPLLEQHQQGARAMIHSPPLHSTKEREGIYQEQRFSVSHSHLLDSSKSNLFQQLPEFKKKAFPWAKRHSLDLDTPPSSAPPLPSSSSSILSRDSDTLSTQNRDHRAKVLPLLANSMEARFKTEIMTLPLTPLFRLRALERQRECELGFGYEDDNDNDYDDPNYDDHHDGEDSGQGLISVVHHPVWQTTVLVHIPGPAEMATWTATKSIIKTHTLQLILLCGMVEVEGLSEKAENPPQGGASETMSLTGSLQSPTGTYSSASSADSTTAPQRPVKFSAPVFPSLNKEFRLAMDLHVTGPRAPVSISSRPYTHSMSRP